MLTYTSVLCDFKDTILTQDLLRSDVQDGIPPDIRMIDHVVLARRVPGEMGDDAIAGGGKPHVGCQLHGWHGYRFVKTLPAAFFDGDFGDEVSQGGPEVFGDDGCLALLFGLEAVDLGQGLKGLGAPALDSEGIYDGQNDYV